MVVCRKDALEENLFQFEISIAFHRRNVYIKKQTEKKTHKWQMVLFLANVYPA